ncbi:MAG: glycosyltransferase family 4 protein [Colwellia sp.]
MKKILHVRSTIGMYGAEKVVLNLMKAFIRLNTSATVAVIEGMNPQAQYLAKELTEAGLPHTALPSSRRFDIRVIGKLRDLMKSEGIAIVHTHDYKSLLLSSIAALLLDVRLIHHVHGSLGNTLPEKLYGIIERICMYRVSKIITVSEAQREQYAVNKFYEKKIIKVDNGTQLPDFYKNRQANNPFTIAMVARFTPEKNHQLAIDILALLVSRKKEIRLLFLGDGPCLNAIKRMVDSQGLASQVQFVGFTNKVQKWLRSTDLLLITSVTEGMPMCLLEAMAMGIPAVSTPVGEIPALLKAANSGEVAKTKDNLAQAIIRVMDDAQLYEKYCLNARDYIKENLSVNRQAINLNEIYSEKVGGRNERY